jgi:hypothetical protein
MSITLLSPHLDAKFFEQTFLDTYPRFKDLPSHDESMDGHIELSRKVLERAHQTSTKLGLTDEHLIDRLIRPTHTSPHSALAALTLLASGSTAPHVAISDCMPVLTAALSSTAIDSGLAWLWHTVHNRDGIEFENATMLLEVSYTPSLQVTNTNHSSLYP